MTLFSTAFFDNGSASSDLLNHLIDASASWTSLPGLNAGDGVKNTTAVTYGTVTAINSDMNLTLSSDLFPGGNENFEIYDRIDNGTASDVSVDFRLTDTANADAWTALVAVGDVVWNLTTGAEATVTLVAGDDDLDLSADIFNAVGDSYIILAAAALDSGTANADLLNHLIDAGANFTSAIPPFPVVAGDLVRNTGAGTYATVTAVSATDLTLDADIFPLGAGNYEIYHEYCTSHMANPIDPFYRLTVNWAINITAPTVYDLYDYKSITGTADTPPANPLFDDGANFLSVVAPLPVVLGDIVINFTNLAGFIQIATVSPPYAVHARAANLSSDILADGDDFEIVRYSPWFVGGTAGDVVRWGTATGGTPTTLVDAGTNFTAAPAAAVGDIVYNLADDEYAMVTAVAANTLTLSRDATFGGGEPYMIVRNRGVLYVWQTAGPEVHAKVLSIDDPSVELVSEWIFNLGSSPRTLADGDGNAIVVYVDTAGEIQVVKLDAARNYIWTTELDTQVANAESILKVLSDGLGGVVVLYKHNNNLYVQRMTGAGVRQWGANGRTVEAFAIITSQEDMAYIAAADDVIVVANESNDIWAVRVGTTSWAPYYISNPAASIQQNPRIYYNSGLGTAIIVWDDNRFVSNAGYGLFGMQINAATGVRNPAWRANQGGVGADDYNGVAVILNRFNDGAYGNVRLMPYDNSNEALIFWEDYRAGNSSDVVAFDLNSFIP